MYWGTDVSPTRRFGETSVLLCIHSLVCYISARCADVHIIPVDFVTLRHPVCQRNIHFSPGSSISIGTASIRRLTSNSETVSDATSNDAYLHDTSTHKTTARSVRVLPAGSSPEQLADFTVTYEAIVTRIVRVFSLCPSSFESPPIRIAAN